MRKAIKKGHGDPYLAVVRSVSNDGGDGGSSGVTTDAQAQVCGISSQQQ